MMLCVALPESLTWGRILGQAQEPSPSAAQRQPDLRWESRGEKQRALQLRHCSHPSPKDQIQRDRPSWSNLDALVPDLGTWRFSIGCIQNLQGVELTLVAPVPGQRAALQREARVRLYLLPTPQRISSTYRANELGGFNRFSREALHQDLCGTAAKVFVTEKVNAVPLSSKVGMVRSPGPRSSKYSQGQTKKP